jgi:hypothetical protein
VSKSKLFYAALGVSFIFMHYYYYLERQEKEQKRAERSAACLVSPSCQDEAARGESALYSGKAIRSKSGRYYFNGKACTDYCSGHVAGFNWAEERGISKEAGCEDGKSISFIEGCEAYVEAVQDELNSEDYEPDMPEPEYYCSGRGC